MLVLVISTQPSGLRSRLQPCESGARKHPAFVGVRQRSGTSVDVLATTLSRRVQVPNCSIPGVWVVALTVQVSGKYMMLDTWTLRVLAWS